MSALGSGGRSGHGHSNEKQEHPAIRFTPEELRVLKDCNRDSFYYRCVPFSTAAMLATHYAVKMGYLRSSPKYGSLFKVIGAGVFGYLIGKISYRSKCEERLMQVPNGQVAELLRRRKQGLPAFPEIYTMNPSYAVTENENEMAADRNRAGLGGQGTWEIDTDRNVESQGLDDSKRPSLDNPMKDSKDDQQNKTQATYDTLRKQNREEFEARRSNFYGRKEQQRSTVEQKLPPTRSESTPGYSGVRNEYGDIVEQ